MKFIHNDIEATVDLSVVNGKVVKAVLFFFMNVAPGFAYEEPFFDFESGEVSADFANGSIDVTDGFSMKFSWLRNHRSVEDVLLDY